MGKQCNSSSFSDLKTEEGRVPETFTQETKVPFIQQMGMESAHGRDHIYCRCPSYLTAFIWSSRIARRGQSSKNCRHCNALCQWPLLVTVRAILGNDSNTLRTWMLPLLPIMAETASGRSHMVCNYVPCSTYRPIPWQCYWSESPNRVDMYTVVGELGNEAGGYNFNIRLTSYMI